MGYQQIPLVPKRNQAFQATLLIDGSFVTRQYSVTYNEMANCWNLSISDTIGNLLVDSVPFTTGGTSSANILKPYSYMGLGSAYVISASGNVSSDHPNLADLGVDWALIWFDTTQ